MTESKAPAYQWYPKDYLSDVLTTLMTLEEEGAYRRLLDHSWLEGSIPNDMKALGRMCKGLPPERMQEIWKSLEPCFRLKGDRWFHPRLEQERKKQKANREAKSRAGKLGAEARYNKGKTSSAIGVPVAKPNSTSASASASSTTEKKTTYTAEFAEIWAVHGRGPKQKAFAEYKKAIKEQRITHKELRQALAEYKKTFDDRFKGAHLFRWISDDRWDEIERPSGLDKRGIIVGGRMLTT